MQIDSDFLKQPIFDEGGEGTLYLYKDILIKIYKSHINIAAKERKIKALISKTLPPQAVKPIECVYLGGKFVGYSMPKINGEELKQLSKKKYIKANNIKMKDILKVLVAVKNTLLELHSQGILIGDLNDSNILFTPTFDVYFIDCDSWSIGADRCEVCMDSFKDPKLVGDMFTKETDYYAYDIMFFKSLTKLHPFGGTTTPDMDVLQRMTRGISVIDNTGVTIPKIIQKWNYIPPKLLECLKEVFDNAKRFIPSSEIDDFYKNLKQCKVDGEYYYSKFSTCPFCDAAAKIVDKPQKKDTVNGIPLMLYLSGDDIGFILSLDSYISNTGEVIHTKTKTSSTSRIGVKHYFSNDGSIKYGVDTGGTLAIQCAGKVCYFDRARKSDVRVIDNKCYYITPQLSLVELTVTPMGNSQRIIGKCSFNNMFDIADKDNYLICNIFDFMKIINICGYNYEIPNSDKVVNYGIHYDKSLKLWLLVLEYDNGHFDTFVFDKNRVEFYSDVIKYTSDLSNICFDNGIIFTPFSGGIRGFGYKKNVYKDFVCPVVTEDSRLSRERNKFFIINEKEIYLFG